MEKTNNFYIRPSEAEDVQYLYDKLREDDIEEITALGSNPLVSLCEGFIFSKECYTCVYEDKPIGMFGLGLSDNEQGSIWFLGTEMTQKLIREWVKWGGQYINRFLNIYPILTNMVSVNNIAHIRWLKKLGAIFSAPYNYNNQQFLDFYFIKREE